MRIWSVLVLIFLNIVTKVLSCTYIGYYNDRYSYECRNMTHNQYIIEINTILNSYDISHLGIVQVYLPIIAQDMFTHYRYEFVISLTIKQCGVTTIENHTFDKFKQLEYLDIFENNIKYFDENFITSLRYLHTMNLSNFTLNEIKPQAFNGLKSVHSLNLNSNKIYKFSCGIFKENNNIHNLDLSNNEIVNISICVFQHLTNLKYLDLQNNRIKELEVDSLSAFNQLQVLNLSHNELNTLSETVLHPLDSLEELDISANRFTRLDPRTLFAHLTTLKQVDLSGNLWSCHNLTSIRKYLRTKNISFKSKILNFTVANIGGNQCVDEQNNEFEGGTVEYKEEYKISNKKNEITLKEYSQNPNNNFENLVMKLETLII